MGHYVVIKSDTLYVLNQIQLTIFTYKILPDRSYRGEK